MSLKNLIVKSIDKMSFLLESFDNRSFAKGCYRYIRNRNNNFVTVFKEPRDYQCSEVHISEINNVGIVIQGPVMHEDNFTLETIRIFRKWYPNIKIVLSTWIGSLNEQDKELLKEYNCHTIESNDLGGENKGKGEKTGHLNNQILSSRLGIEYMESEGVEYVLKLRSDVRIFKDDFINYFVNTLKLYKDTRFKLINIAFSNSMYNVPFHMSDFLWFGEIEHMKKLYSVPYRDESALQYIREFVESEEYQKYKDEFQSLTHERFRIVTDWFDKKDYFQNSKFLLTYHEEIYLPYNFWREEVNTIGQNLLEDYYSFLSDIIVLDDRDLLVFWNKSLYSVIQSDYSYKVSNRLTHSKWLSIYLDRKGSL